MTQGLTMRLADALRKYEPDSPLLEEDVCRQCGGLGAGWIADDRPRYPWSFNMPKWHVCTYCGGKGSGRSKAYADALKEPS